MCFGFTNKTLQALFERCVHIVNACLCRLMPHYNCRKRLRCTSFILGFSLAQAYYYYLWKDVPFPYKIGRISSLFISLLLGIGNCISIQIRCVCLLVLPMYCGKPGRGVLKAVLLTYVVAGPIANLGLNAREIVRVFACSNQLSYNLSKEKHDLISEPFKKTAISLQTELNRLKDAISSVNDQPVLEREIEDTQETQVKQKQNEYIDNKFGYPSRSKHYGNKFRSIPNNINTYEKLYRRKLVSRCENQHTQAVSTCLSLFADAYERCNMTVPYKMISAVVCWPLKLAHVCNIMTFREDNSCRNDKQTVSGVGVGYVAYKSAKHKLTENLEEAKIERRLIYEKELFDIQDAKETGDRVILDSDEKHIIMEAVANVLNACVAVLFLRIVAAAVTYHDMYLTSIEYDNRYVTTYFKVLDQRRAAREQIHLLPLKKMERSKYIDVYSISYNQPEHGKRLTQMLKLMLEVVTATTFVMLDRLFYEALDVVRKHAQIDTSTGMDYLDIHVEGTGILASLLRKLSSNFAPARVVNRTLSNAECLPRPRAMPPVFFVKIYGGYLWILLLVYINPYTLRLNRLICSYFYPRREKQRILHLYNDILKKRMKMSKTLRRKAIQTARAHYLSGENLLSLRMKFPNVFGWTRILPIARMTCLICGETEPRIAPANQLSQERWHRCSTPSCPFVFCNECWVESGAMCLACDPSLIDMSDIESLSEDDKPRY